MRPNGPAHPDRPADVRPAKRGRWRLVLAYLAFLGLLAEAGSWAALRWTGGEGWAQTLRHEQTELAAAARREGSIPDPAVGPASLRDEVLHPYLGYLPVFREGQRVTGGVSLNEERFFAPDSPVFAAREDDALVVGILGGSVAAFFAREGAPALEAGLADDPRFAGKHFRYAVMAFGGFKQPQQLASVAWVLALGGRFDILINIDGFNEVALHEADNAPQGVGPSYPRAWYFRSPPDQLTLPLVGEIAYLRGERAESAARALASPFSALASSRMLWKLRDRSFRRSIEARDEALHSYRPRTEGTTLAGPPAPEGRALHRYLADIWCESSLQLHRLCAANGIRYYHVLQPNQYVEGSKPLSETERRTAYREDHRYRHGARAGYPWLIADCQALRDEGVRCLDATGVFAGIDETLYVDDCCHFSERGNRILGEAIAAFIRSTD